MWDSRVQDLNFEEYSDARDCDVWGAAICWYIENGKEMIGAEYNYCKEGGHDMSAIYSMRYNGDPDDPDSRIETDGCDFQHYEIDWTKPDWNTQLLNAMQNFVKERM